MSVDTERPSVQSTEKSHDNHNNTRSSTHSNNSHPNCNKSTASTTSSSSVPSAATTTCSSSSSQKGMTTTAMTTSPSTSPSSALVLRELQQQGPQPQQQQTRAQTPPNLKHQRPFSPPTVPESPRASYFRRIREQQELAMERFFQTTIDAPCYALEEQLEYLTRCQQPKQFWNNVFHHGTHEDDDDMIGVGTIPMGMYVVPQYCEYCGASNTRLCPPSCQRPKLFFRKKRPPFCNQLYRWDAETEYELPRRTHNHEITTSHHPRQHENHNPNSSPTTTTNAMTRVLPSLHSKTPPSQEQHHWVHGIKGMFHGNVDDIF